MKISVIPNGLEKYMAFTINKNLVFIDSMINCILNLSLDKLVKNLSDKDFKYLSEEYSGEQLKLVKEKGVYPYECGINEKNMKELLMLGKYLKQKILVSTMIYIQKQTYCCWQVCLKNLLKLV